MRVSVRNKKDAWKAAKKQHPMSKKRMRGGRMTIEVFKADGPLAERYIGPTNATLLRQHAYGQCWSFCSYCIFEGDQYAKTHPEINYK